ncbi:MAG: tetratricopeptide repeat protein [Rhodobacteraceae bacterium]|nr:tetratricopeptide repeat protein [Paracoccaceae bacterium]
MANTDSFIEEVTEEVRRDRLFALFRRYGWIAAALILLLVGAAGFREWNSAQRQAKAEAFGNRILTVLEADNSNAALTALGGIEAEDNQQAVIQLYMADSLLNSDDAQAAVEVLDRLAGDVEIAQVYRDLAVLKAAWIGAEYLPSDEIIARAAPLEVSASAFRPMAIETRAHMLIRQGQIAQAVDVLRQLENEAGLPQAMRGRLSQLLDALDTGATQSETESDSGSGN